MDDTLDKLPILVETPEALAGLIERLDGCSVVAIDTESNSLFAYHEQVCLIQISMPRADYVIDALALSDLSPLGALFADPSREKVFHGADYDIGVLRRDYAYEFSNVFDTMIASRILGIKRFGLGNLLECRFGVRLDKRMQRHDWSRRPLRKEELQYARLDTHYLLPLRDQLLQELREQGREREAREAFERVAYSTWNRKPFDANDYWRIKQAQHLNPSERGVLRALYIMREDLARRRNRPRFKIISDKTLVDISRSRPMSKKSLRSVPGMSARLIQTCGDAILSAVRAGLNNPQEKLCRPDRGHRPDQEVLDRYERLREWRRQRGLSRDVEPDVLISNSQLMEIARHAPASMEELDCLCDLGSYQLEAYGRDILAIIEGEN